MQRRSEAQRARRAADKQSERTAVALDQAGFRSFLERRGKHRVQ
jgi:hypothetical protein